MTLLDLDLSGRPVLVVGGGPVAARRAANAVAAGARLRVVAPTLVPDLVALAASGDAQVEQRPVREDDVDGSWFVWCCTGDVDVDAAVLAWATDRRVFCVVAADGTAGTARTPAGAQVAGMRVAVVSDGSPDPRRVATVRDRLVDALLEPGTDTRAGRPDVAGPDVLLPGEVALVGGGTGDPALMTVRARTLLAQADVVVTDRLGPTAVLDDLRDDVEVVAVGKAPGLHSATQAEIEDVLVDRARAGHRVVRLKGGDPFLFGRGGEEVLACRAAGISVRVVPGVTSAVAAAGSAGIPVTHRGTSDRVHVINGHGGLSDLDLAGLRDARVTTVVLMGMAGIARWSAQALAAGVDPATPAAVVANATLPDERVVHAPLGDVVARCAEQGVRSPAVVVVGEVARPGLLDPAVTTPVIPGTRP
ncbi:uroporphyrinogen-III C-methyltransferase [Cellulomonas triticagri]|uniref:uroporphyrinogen-III C-methyltransferase n=1 Tax=Cellulomonas triticagri TaxID=2483352 RepID=A0A3M2JAE4_9CELL|nr:uroporphyrinogen-III C-methyltransferase [Cellulomonas triticagri]RMI09081.1 uroporphyrinogen-III C-methyltransferase [Cellulomonas triticagri]